MGTVKMALKKKLAGAYDRWDEALPGVTFAINTKDAALSRTAPFTLFFGRAASPWQDYTLQELQLKYGDPGASELEEEHKAFRDEVVGVTRAAAAARQDKANGKLDGDRKLVQHDFPPNSFVMIHDPHRTSKHDPANYGPFQVLRKSARVPRLTSSKKPFRASLYPGRFRFLSCASWLTSTARSSLHRRRASRCLKYWLAGPSSKDAE